MVEGSNLRGEGRLSSERAIAHGESTLGRGVSGPQGFGPQRFETWHKGGEAIQPRIKFVYDKWNLRIEIDIPWPSSIKTAVFE